MGEVHDSAITGRGTGPIDIETVSFQLISLAGEAKSLAMQAMKAAENSDFDAADELLEQSRQSFVRCHDVQSGLITAQARGDDVPVSLLLVHAQDHLTMASMALDNAKTITNLYRRLALSPSTVKE